jgi:plastocyanin
MRYIYTPVVVTLALAGTAFAETHTVFANNTSFSPDAIGVAQGDTIVWQYNSGYPHTVTSGVACTADDLFNGELQNGGDTFTWEVPLDVSGDIPYFCEPHCSMGMDGIITVLSGSNVLNVPTEYPTIESALNAASDGDTIAIAAGTYTESDLYIEDANIVITGEVNAEGAEYSLPSV